MWHRPHTFTQGVIFSAAASKGASGLFTSSALHQQQQSRKPKQESACSSVHISHPVLLYSRSVRLIIRAAGVCTGLRVTNVCGSGAHPAIRSAIMKTQSERKSVLHYDCHNKRIGLKRHDTRASTTRGKNNVSDQNIRWFVRRKPILGESLFGIIMYQLVSNGVISGNAHEPIHE